MDPITKYLTAIKDEITNDPESLGYDGKSPKEQKDLLNSPYTILVPQEQTARIAQIINQIPFAPNIASEQQVIDSKSPITPEIMIATGQEIGADAVTP